MMQSNTELSPRAKAIAAGGLWWVCIILGVVGFVVGAPLIVANDATATATNILAKESLFRLGFVADLISGLSYVGVTAFIYYLLKPVSRSLSLVGAFFGLAGVAIGGASWVIHLTPLLLLHGDAYLTGRSQTSDAGLSDRHGIFWDSVHLERVPCRAIDLSAVRARRTLGRRRNVLRDRLFC